MWTHTHNFDTRTYACAFWESIACTYTHTLSTHTYTQMRSHTHMRVRALQLYRHCIRTRSTFSISLRMQIGNKDISTYKLEQGKARCKLSMYLYIVSLTNLANWTAVLMLSFSSIIASKSWAVIAENSGCSSYFASKIGVTSSVPKLYSSTTHNYMHQTGRGRDSSRERYERE